MDRQERCATHRIHILFLAIVVFYGVACVPPSERKEPTEATNRTTTSPLPPGVDESRPTYSDPNGSLRLYCTGGTRDGFPLAFHIVGASDRIHAISGQPSKREPELEKGTWLVVAVGVFSGSDVKSAVNAIRAIESRTDDVQLGARPFFNYDESETWFGPYGDIDSPLWVIFKDGKIIHTEKGSRTQDEVTAMIKTALAKR